MRPNARSFAPAVVDSDTAQSLVRYAHGDDSQRHGCDKGRECLDHEVLHQLVGDFHRLNHRCDILEAQNTSLQSEIAALTDSSATSSTLSSNVAVKPTYNLSGYASSDASEEADLNSTPRDALDGFERRIEQQIYVVQQILEKFREDLTEGNKGRISLGKELERTRQELTAVRGRTGWHHKRLEAIEEQVEEAVLQASNAVQRRQSHIAGSNGPTQQQFEAMRQQMSKLEKEVHTQGLKKNEVHAGGAGSVNGVAERLPEQESLEKALKRFQRDATIRATQNARVDDASTKEMLYEYYHQLTHDIDAIQDENDVAGPFEGDSDELWALRDRVVCRLSIFENYAKALREAKDADVAV